MFNPYAKAVLMLAAAATVACQSELPGIPPEETYERNFIKDFGTISPTQDWNAATRVVATVTPALTATAATYEVYTAMPGNKSARLAARYEATDNTFGFDIAKSATYAYVRVIDAKGNITYSGYCPIENGTLAIGGVSSRADETVPSLKDISDYEAFSYFRAKDPVFWGNIVEDYATKIDSYKDEGKELLNQSVEIWSEGGNGSLQFDKEFAIIDPENMEVTVTVIPREHEGQKGIALKATAGYGGEIEVSTFKPEITEENVYKWTFTLTKEQLHKIKKECLKIVRISGDDWYGGTITSVKYKISHSLRFSDAFKFYEMSGHGTPSAEGYPIADIDELVGAGGVFKDGVAKNETQCNLLKYQSMLNPYGGVEFTVTEDDTELALEYFFGSTSMYNSFGYFYYKEGDSQEAIMKKPKYILAKDVCPGSNIQTSEDGGNSYCYFSSLDNANDQGMDATGDWQNHQKLSNLLVSENKANVRVKSNNYKLVYYGDGDTPDAGTYKFPAGTKIAFFTITSGYYAMEKGKNGNYRKSIDGGSLAFSLPWMNTRIGNVRYKGHSHKDGGYVFGDDSNLENEMPNISFVTYKWRDEYIIGMEDSPVASDDDMNDMLFRFKTTKTVDSSNDTEIKDTPTPPQSWILAAEDMGSIGDYDFNDMVVGISHVSGESKMTLTGIASGGTYPIYLQYGGEDIDDEFHSWFGKGSNTVHIAGIGKTVEWDCDPEFTVTQQNGNFSGENSLYGFSLRVEAPEGPHKVELQQPGGAPHMLLMTTDWNHPLEGHHITLAYPGFSDWKDQTMGLEDMIKGCDSGHVHKHGWQPK